MTTTTTAEQPTGALVPVTDPLFTVAERQALAGFLSGYSGLTRDPYTLDLRHGPAALREIAIFSPAPFEMSNR